MNISGALGSIFEFIRAVNKHLDANEVNADGAQAALAMLDRLDAVVGILGDAPAADTPQEILELVEARQQARRDKDFSKADALRDELTAKGWILEDTPDGPKIKQA